MRKASYATLVSAVVLLLAAQCVRADIIYDSLGQTPYSGGGQRIGGGGEYTQGFSVGPANYDLTNVIISMNVGMPGFATSGGDASDFTLSIYDASGVDNNSNGYGAPGNLLTTLVGTGVPTGGDASDPYVSGQYTYGPSTPFVLNANTTYYVVANSTSPNGSYYWDDTTALGPDVGTGLWGNPDLLGGWEMSGPFAPQLMQVNADPVGTVPEPGTLALLLLGLPMAGLLKRRRK